MSKNRPRFAIPDVSKWDRPDWGIRVEPRKELGIDLRDCLIGKAGVVLEESPSNHALAPRGAIVDPDSPHIPFTVSRKLQCWADNIAGLYENAKGQQWDATKDIPWRELKPLPEDIERAVCQLMTFIIINEHAALYLPARLITEVSHYFSEVALFLSTQVVDEARHIEVFRKRALANGGGLMYVPASTQWSLKSLIEQETYCNASFLLHILGEGTFESLFKFLQEVAPDPVTKRIAVYALRDEARHVGYGVAHLRYHLGREEDHYKELFKAVEDRAAFLYEMSVANPMVQEALATLAGGGSEPYQVERGVERIKGLHRLMHEDRVKRLRLAGFDDVTAERMSRLHAQATQNAM